MWLGGVLIFALVCLMIPLKTTAMLTGPFTMKRFGVRKIKRWHSQTDTLANLMLWISVLFCIAAPFIPYSPLIYGLWLTFTWLCTISRVPLMGRVKSKNEKLAVLFLLNLTYGVGLVAGLGMINGYRLWLDTFTFANMIESLEAFDIMLYLSDPMPAGFLLQIILLIWPLARLWGQFKYMRLEGTYKAVSITSYVVKSLIVIAAIALLGSFGDVALEKVYQKNTEEIVEEGHLPLNRKKLDSYKGSLLDKIQSEPAADSQNAASPAQSNSQALSQQTSDPNQVQPENPEGAAQSADAQNSLPEEPVEVYEEAVPEIADPNAGL